MIPPDLTARLRLLTEASFFSKEPQQVAALRGSEGVSEDLPDFQPGQRIVATLREARADDSFRALINGREYTLTLPRQQARTGQTLDLIVTQASPRAILATIADGSVATVSTSLSQTGRLISFLLTGHPAAQTASLSSGQAVLSSPPSAGAAVAPMLRQAVVESGLFYESQLARWLAGAVSTDSLLRQPQSRLTGARATPGGATPGTTSASTDSPTAMRAGSSPAPTSAPAGAGAGAGALRALGGDADAVNAANQGTAAQRNPGQSTAQNPIPERLLPIVHQQLDALATHSYAWQGAIWPGQSMQWEIEEPGEGGGEGDPRQSSDWTTTLRLTLPRLGGIEAQLQLTRAGVAVRLAAADGATVAALESARQQLADALAAADVPLTGMSVERALVEDSKT